MSKSGQPPPPLGFSAAPPPSAPPSYAQAMGGVPPQAPYYPQQGPSPADKGKGYIPVHQGHPQSAPTTIVTTVVPLGGSSTHMVCPHCHHEIDTATKSAPSKIAWLSCLILCLVGCNLGCCFIPFCMDDCMNTEHNCPNCKAYLGQFSKN